MLYTQERDLTRDAKRTELEFAKARIFVARLKAAFISGKLQIIRMIMAVLCIGVLAVPFAGIRISAPLFEAGLSLGAIGVYQMISSGVYAVALDLAEIPLIAPQIKILFACAAVFAALVICAAFIFLIEILSFININKTAKIISAASIAAAALSVALIVLGFVLKSGAGDASFLSASVGFGGFAATPVFIGMFILSRKIIAANITPSVSENDILRADTLKKVKSGEVSLDELPLPVYETDEEREERIRKSLEDVEKGIGGVTVE